MLPVVTDVAWSVCVCLSVCLSVITTSPETVLPVDQQRTDRATVCAHGLVSPRNHVLGLWAWIPSHRNGHFSACTMTQTHSDIVHNGYGQDDDDGDIHAHCALISAKLLPLVLRRFCV